MVITVTTFAQRSSLVGIISHHINTAWFARFDECAEALSGSLVTDEVDL